MNIRRLTVARTLVVALMLPLAVVIDRAQQANSAEAIFGEALHKEQIESNFKSAAELYKKVIAEPKASRDLTARALLQLGSCDERLGLVADARVAYERIVKEFAASGSTAKTAQLRLASMQTPGSALTETLITNDRLLGGLGVQRWSPDGRYVIGLQLSASEFDGHPMKLLDVTTTRSRTLFSRPPGFGPIFSVFSPDSQWFAAIAPVVAPQSEMVEWIRTGKDSASLAVPGFLVVGRTAEGATPIVVDIPAMPSTNSGSPLAWSPKGLSVAYAMPSTELGTSDIELMNAQTGAKRSLGVHVTGAISLLWSKSGEQLLVRSSGDAHAPSSLRVVTMASDSVREIAIPGDAGASLIGTSLFTNDIGVRVVEPGKAGLQETFLISTETGKSRKTCAGGNHGDVAGYPGQLDDSCGRVARDGAVQLIWQHTSKRMAVRTIATGLDRPLTSASGEEYYGNLSPNGHTVVFVSNRDGRWGLYAADLNEEPVSHPTRLSTFNDMPVGFNIATWTPDGFIAGNTINESNIVRVNIDKATGKSTGTERLTQDATLNHTPVVSPDGKHIAYWTKRGSQYGIAVMDSDGANERLIFETDEDGPGLQPVWRSPSELLFTLPPNAKWAESFAETLNAPPVTRRLMSLNTTTGVAAPIGELSMPLILAQAQYVAASSEIVHLDSDYRTVRAESLIDSGSRVIAKFEGDAEVDSLLVSPNGKSIAYVLAQRYPNGRACFSKSETPAASVNDILTTCEMGVLDIATGQRTQLRALQSPNGVVAGLMAWSPDGKFLIFGQGQPRLLDTTTQSPAPSQLLPPGTPISWDRTASWSPDGTFIAITDKSQRFELRQWKGIK